MIISRTPYRISFFGGGTDYPAWYREHGGAVLSTTINRYGYITCRHLPPFFDYKSRIVWSQIERVSKIADIQHPVVRCVLGLLAIKEGVEIHHDGDLPSRTGLGSSSSFTVGLLHALHALGGKMVSKLDLARQAVDVEQNLLKEHVGVQDQIAAAFGGLNRISFGTDDSFDVQPLVLPPQRLRLLEERLLLFYTGVSRIASTVAEDKIRSIPSRQNELSTMLKMVDQGIDILAAGDIDDFGRLLHEAWQLKRSLSSKISPQFVDDIYERARSAGALGGKLLGAGGGGFILFYTPPEARAGVLKALQELLVVPVEFERQGSQIIFYEPDRYSPTALNMPGYVRYSDDRNGGKSTAAADSDTPFI